MVQITARDNIARRNTREVGGGSGEWDTINFCSCNSSALDHWRALSARVPAGTPTERPATWPAGGQTSRCRPWIQCHFVTPDKHTIALITGEVPHALHASVVPPLCSIQNYPCPLTRGKVRMPDVVQHTSLLLSALQCVAHPFPQVPRG